MYGGGGITPDFFIAIDSILYDTSLNKYYANNAIGNYSYKYFIKNRTILSNFKKPNDFISNFELNNNDIKEFISFSEKSSTVSYKPTNQEILFLKTRIKALISRILWGETGYHMVLNEKDPTVIKSKELMK